MIPENLRRIVIITFRTGDSADVSLPALVQLMAYAGKSLDYRYIGLSKIKTNNEWVKLSSSELPVLVPELRRYECTECGKCIRTCAGGALKKTPERKAIHFDTSSCRLCHQCLIACRQRNALHTRPCIAGLLNIYSNGQHRIHEVVTNGYPVMTAYLERYLMELQADEGRCIVLALSSRQGKALELALSWADEVWIEGLQSGHRESDDAACLNEVMISGKAIRYMDEMPGGSSSENHCI